MYFLLLELKSVKLFSFSSIHSVRQFPDFFFDRVAESPEDINPLHGSTLINRWDIECANSYRPLGIAALCDWQIMSDRKGGCVLLRNGVYNPKTIFVSLRGGVNILQIFEAKVLPFINHEFVLISGSEDLTIPNQIDQRFPQLSTEQCLMIERLRCDRRVISWFVENLDENKPKLNAIPTGYVFAGSGSPIKNVEVSCVPLTERPKQVFCGHRIRANDQWNVRRQVSALCKDEWRNFLHLLDFEVSIENFISHIRKFPFTLCVEGGGLDPSPKAWLTLATGSIPIIKRSPTAAEYEKNLPVIVVDDWDSSAISLKKIESWSEEFNSWVTCSVQRQDLETKLSVYYWWEKIIESYRSHQGNRF